LLFFFSPRDFPPL